MRPTTRGQSLARALRKSDHTTAACVRTAHERSHYTSTKWVATVIVAIVRIAAVRRPCWVESVLWTESVVPKVSGTCPLENSPSGWWAGFSSTTWYLAWPTGVCPPNRLTCGSARFCTFLPRSQQYSPCYLNIGSNRPHLAMQPKTINFWFSSLNKVCSRECSKYIALHFADAGEKNSKSPPRIELNTTACT